VRLPPISSEPVFKTYDSFQIAFHESGQWRTARAPTLTEAKAKGRLIAKRLAENGSDVPELSHSERRIYFAAKAILQPHKLELDAAARLLAELLERLNGMIRKYYLDSVTPEHAKAWFSL